MAINYELINKGGISLGTNFELLSEKPLDSRLVVPSLDGLQNYIDSAAAYEGMIAYVSSEKKHYEVKVIDGVLSYRPFGLTEAELNDLITNATTAAMEFKGATATLPENPAKGDMYKVAGENINIKIDDVDAKLGDSIVYDGANWFLIPSGDDIEDTWRPVDGVNNDATLKFVDGDKTVAAVAADGTIKYNHATVATPVDVTAEGDEKTRTYITAVETDGYGHITGYKTATENVEDTNTEYTFESQVESSSVYFNVTPNTEGATEETIYVDAYSKNEADGKFVAKETGKSLISDDEIARLAEVDNYDDEEVRGLIGDNAQAIEDLEGYVGTIPTDEKYADITNVISYVNKKAEETLAAAQGGSSETAASVKQQLDNYKSENDTRVKAVEDSIDAINNADTGILKQAKDYADGLAGNYDEKGAAAGVKTELEAEIAKKVDKVEGKDLIATSEITRLAGVTNYDDTQVKADIAKKADAEAMTTELGKKVDKVEGKDLIATSEIERLATLKNYDDTALSARVTTAEGEIDALQEASAKHVEKVEGKSLILDTEIARLAGMSDGANKVEASATNGSIKIDGVETVVYTHPEKHAIADVTGLQDALDGKQAAGDYAAEVHTHVKADITDFAHTHTASEITDFATEVAKVKVDNAAKADEATKATQDGNGKVIADTYAEKATTLAGYGIGDAYTKDEVDDEIEGAINTFVGAYITSDGGAIDKLQEIANWIDSDKDGAADVIADIEANATGIENLGKRMDAAEDAIEAIDNHSHTNKTELDKIADGDVAKWNAAEQNAKDYADGIDSSLREDLDLGYVTVFAALNAESAAKATADQKGNVIDETYETKTDAAQKLTDAKAYTDALKDGLTSGEIFVNDANYAITATNAVYAESDKEGNDIIATYATKTSVTEMFTWGSF